MSPVLDRIANAVAPQRLTVRKAIPRNHQHMLVVFERDDGTRVAGQWYSDPARTALVAQETAAATGGTIDVRVVDDSGLLLQPDGADRRMPTLHRLVAAPDAVLVAHRPERRATVRHTQHDGAVAYTKVVRRDRLAAMMARADVRIPGVAVPQVTRVDTATGTLTCAALAGRTLQQVLDDPSVPVDEVLEVGRSVGAAVARLHATAPPAGVGTHDAAAETGVTERWLEPARFYGVLDPDRAPLREAWEHALRLLAEPPCAPAYLHRDLHDLQVLVDDEGAVGMLDFDLAALGEPALDLANLLVHLELFAHRQPWAVDRTTACSEGVVEGYAADADVWRRVPAYALTTRIRLAAVNAFRPPRAATALTLLTDPPPGPLSENGDLR